MGDEYKPTQQLLQHTNGGHVSHQGAGKVENYDYSFNRVKREKPKIAIKLGLTT